MRSTPVLFALLTACTPTERPVPTKTPPRVEPPPLAAPAVDPAAAVALPWEWVSHGPVAAERPWTPDAQTLETTFGTVTATSKDDDGLTIRLDGKDARWATPLGEDFSDAAALAATGEALFVAHYHRIATGARLARLSPADGAPAWDVALYGAGPIGHSKYRNDVQLAVDGSDIRVFGWESGGAYVEVRDAATGEPRGHTAVDLELVALPWRWHGDPDDWTRAPVVFDVGDGTRARLEDGDRARLVFEGGADRTAVELPRSEGGLATGAGITHDGTIYFVHASGIATGATLYAIAVRDGTIHWQTRLIGPGPIGHSEYFNQVRIDFVADHVVVYGAEAGGKYIEVVDPTTGHTVVNRRWLP